MNWLFGPRGNPRLVAAGKLRAELAKLGGVRRRLVQLERAGRLRSADASDLQQAEQLLTAKNCSSNDLHALASAIVSGARTLATDDNPLAADFKNKSIIDGPRGNIYRDPDSHAHLLRHTPASCSIRPNPRR